MISEIEVSNEEYQAILDRARRCDFIWPGLRQEDWTHENVQVIAERGKRLLLRITID